MILDQGMFQLPGLAMFSVSWPVEAMSPLVQLSRIPCILMISLGEILIGLSSIFCCHATGELMLLVLSMWIEQRRYDSSENCRGFTG